ncbi:C6 and C2H2 transcription factor RegA-like [Penicillium macrosclerotiorum]|uniref:C6 and C2H2 transcription factor RegA-like n=1 Tax=Penicillium macrosclerotiorum TaxID=303699 RepID=UPI0025497946|nr:C6 and C2H2 transcription factor RegA-like [Penicillium macrosclerotiorum]KAJ5682429.1 C6 and C2H2 transcription factor RegA-like [Penicillium macrosclerotiorum]
MQDITTLGRIPRYADFQLAALATIHGISNMIADCNRILRGSTGQWTTVVTNLWQQELVQLLEQFQFLAVEPLWNSVPAISLIYQTVSLSLSLPLGVLETFSGKDGEERSSTIYESFIQHISPAHLRKASWHAGQILRIAKSLPPGSLIVFRAACVYYSALALWSLATVFSLKGMPPLIETRSTDPVFFLDGKNDGDVLRRFTTLGQGSPVLSSAGQHVHLQDRGAVMRLFQQIFSSEHGEYAIDQQSRALCHAFTILGRNGDAPNGGMEDEDTQY